MKINYNIYLLITILSISSLTNGQNIVWEQEHNALINGSFTGAYSGGLSYSKPKLVDIDNDGDLDLFVGNALWKVLFFRNTGDNIYFQWSLEEPLFEKYGTTFLDPTFTDIDSDGDLDAFIGDWNGQIHFLKNIGSADIPKWEFITDIFDSIDVGYHSSPEFVDIDNDGDLDLFVGNNESKVFFYRNNGDSFSSSFVLEDSSYFVQSNGDGIPEFIDIDNDGDFDCFLSGWGEIEFYRNNGDKVLPLWFREPTPYENILAEGEIGLTFGDLNGDGLFDLVLGEALLGMRYYLNSGLSSVASWTFITKHFATIDIGYPSYITFADIDNDGDDDLLVGQHSYGIYLFENNSDALEHRWTISETPWIEDYNIPAFIDLDNDSDLDMFLGKFDGNISRYKNTGTPNSAIWTLVEANDPMLKTSGSSAPTFADIDNDGDSDLFIGDKDGKINFFENIGNNINSNWGTPDTFYQSIKINGYRGIPVFCDIDQDEDLDLFIGSYNSHYGTIFFYRNTGTKFSPIFVKETEKYADIIDPAHAIPAFTDIDFDGDLDLFVGSAYGGLSFFKNMGIDTSSTSVEIEKQHSKQNIFSLEQNYPNPFNPSTTIKYSINVESYISLSIFDVLGREVATLVNKKQNPGNYKVGLNSEDLSSGVYFYQLRSKEFVQTRKMLLLE